MTIASETWLADDRPAALKRLFEFLSIPSISTEAASAADCGRAAQWLARELESLGFEARTVSTGRHPVILAHAPRVPDAPRVLFYGHYDVQPAGHEDEWDHSPFEPLLLARDGRQVIHGRGAADDKGQVMTFVEACRAAMATGGLPLNVTLLIEGEEEIGSPSLASVLEAHADELAADIALICDTAMLDRRTPVIACQLRGFVGEIVTVRAAQEDLHSGNYGGAARNPAQVLCEALASLRGSDGSVALPGFYTDVAELPEEVSREWAQLANVSNRLLPDVGLAEPAGERNRGVLEQVWSRPCFDINTLCSGHIGEGFKTVLPAHAVAKVSFRLVAAQDPDKIRTAFRDAVRARIPADCRVGFEAYGTVAATQMDVTRPEFAVAKRIVQEVWGGPCVLVGMGGSIPAVGALKTVLGMDSLLLGFGQADDRIHASNEKYDLDSFEKGALTWLRILDALATEGGAAAGHSSRPTQAGELHPA
ncbi:M20/M25/M40 family metallo-hydrolase [Methylobacterium indicum]|uniref:Peptidase M20 dimerisation domain-containing protein n=1 Tax=Methylobacterium indicum TaxID=1775910 RepID=A0A8H8X0L1_9HYPH|nr:M20/M25/M40 family metallo-hydrolase [Methylobacterium indicum]BCM87682.1 hypothetical protein mvi_61430 [Methylobacterium indicum]